VRGKKVEGEKGRRRKIGEEEGGGGKEMELANIIFSHPKCNASSHKGNGSRSFSKL